MGSVNELTEQMTVTKKQPLWQVLIDRIDEIETAKNEGKKYAEFANEFGVSAGAFSDALKRAKTEREKQNSETEKKQSFIPNFQPKKSVETENENSSGGASFSELNEVVSNLKNISENLAKLSEQKTKNLTINKNQIEQINKQISDAANLAGESIVESLNDAASEASKRLSKSEHKQSLNKAILASAAVLVLGLAIGFGLGSKSIYLSMNKQAYVDAAKWNEFVGAYQHATDAEKNAVSDIFSRYHDGGQVAQ